MLFMLEGNVEKQNYDNAQFIPETETNYSNYENAKFIPDDVQPNLGKISVNDAIDSSSPTSFFQKLSDFITNWGQYEYKMRTAEAEHTVAMQSAVAESASKVAFTEIPSFVGDVVEVVGDLSNSPGLQSFGQEINKTTKTIDDFISKKWVEMPLQNPELYERTKTISSALAYGGTQALQAKGLAKNLGAGLTYLMYTIPDGSETFIGYRKGGFGKGEALTAAASVVGADFAIDRYLDGLGLARGMNNTAGMILNIVKEPFAEASQTAMQNMIMKIGPDKERSLGLGLAEAAIGGLGGGAVAVSVGGSNYDPMMNLNIAIEEAKASGATEKDISEYMANFYEQIDAKQEKISGALKEIVNNNAQAITDTIKSMPTQVAYQNVSEFYKTADDFISKNEGTPEAERAKEIKTGLDFVYKNVKDSLKKAGIEEQQADANAKLWQGHALFASQEFGITPEEYYKNRVPEIVKTTYEQFKPVEDYIPYQDGEKMVMYHWTPYKFDTFKISDNDIGIHVGTEAQAGKIKEADGREGEKKMVSVQPQNSLELEDAGMWQANTSFVSQLVDKGIITEKEGNDILTRKDMSMKDKTTFLRNAIKEKGYDSIKYKNEYEKDGDYSYIILDPSKIETVGSINMQQAFVGKYRGAYEAAKNIISLFEKEDASTFMHESSHFFKEELKTLAETSEKAKRMLDDINKFTKDEFNRRYNVENSLQGFVVKDKNGNVVYNNQANGFVNEKVARDYAENELFARGFEQYLREGKAPSNRLKEAFHSFMRWLQHIYKDSKDLGVELTDPQRQVYSDLLGGQDLDYWMSQPVDAIVKETQDVEKTRQGYLDDIINEAVAQGGAVESKIKGKGFRDIWTKAMIPLSTRAKRISPKLQSRLRRFEFNLSTNMNKKYAESKPFLNIWKTMSDEDAIAFDLALKNDYVSKQEEIVKKYNAESEWSKIKAVLSNIYYDAVGTGLDIGYREDYFPRKVKDTDGFLSYLRSTEDWTRYQEALRNADPDNTFSVEEQAEFLNKYMRGFVRVDLMPLKYGSEKTRKIPVVNNEINRFYANSIDSYVSYIEGMNARIESAKFLGKDADNYEDSIGGYLTYLLDNNLIQSNQIDEVRSILQARFGQRGVSNRFLQSMRDISYIYTMGGINSAITQIEDLSVAMYKGGVWNSLSTIFGEKGITKKDLGIENISAEFTSQSKTSKALNKLFKLTGLDAIDSLGKESLINSVLKKYTDMATKNPERLRELVEPIMENETDSTITDIKNGTKSDNVMFLLFSELSDVQPVSLSELPEFYNTSGNLRVLYMLKSFAVKRIDTFRNECFDKIKSKDASIRNEGLKNLGSMTLLMVLCGATKDWLIDLLYGRKTEMPERLLNNIIGLFGISKFHIYKAKEQGFTGVAKELVVPPLFSFFDDLIGDVAKVSEGKRKVKDLEVLKGIPLIGRFYYWWFGRGKTKQQKTRGGRS